MGDVGCLVPRVIVGVHREQARSYGFLCVHQIAGNKKPTLRSVF